MGDKFTKGSELPAPRRGRSGGGCCALFLAALLLTVLFPHGVRPSEPLPGSPDSDPHDAVPCVKCHVLADETTSPADSPIDYDQEILCRECHEGFSLHPAGIPIEKVVAGSGDITLPLLPFGDDKYITCLTCHHFHGMKRKRHLVRDPGGLGSGRLARLCCSCHSEDNLKGMSPHKRGNSTCKLCHREVPEKGHVFNQEEYSSFQEMCNFCHGRMPDDHFRDINPLSDPELSITPENLGLLFIGGEYACFSCHNPHDETEKDQKLLKREYIELAAYSRRINPHWKNVMCITCHSKKPERGKPGLRMGGNVNLLCIRCHNDDTTAGFLHPVECEPSNQVKVPENLPLMWGQITCQTCHDSSLQETGADIHVVYRANPSFLRMDGLTPSEFCFLCHIQEFFSQVNVHDQIDEYGFLKKRMCAGCHYVLPKDDGQLNLTTDWETDPKEYCILCHKSEVYVENHPSGPHVGEPTRKVYYTMLSAERRIGAPLPLFQGRITCSTCHDPHQMGVLKGHSRFGDDKTGSSVRAQYRELLCTGCHVRE